MPTQKRSLLPCYCLVAPASQFRKWPDDCDIESFSEPACIDKGDRHLSWASPSPNGPALGGKPGGSNQLGGKVDREPLKSGCCLEPALGKLFEQPALRPFGSGNQKDLFPYDSCGNTKKTAWPIRTRDMDWGRVSTTSCGACKFCRARSRQADAEFSHVH